MPKAFPREFRDEVVRVARRREQPIRQTAKDFGISESCLNRWLALDEFELIGGPQLAHRFSDMFDTCFGSGEALHNSDGALTDPEEL